MNPNIPIALTCTGLMMLMCVARFYNAFEDFDDRGFRAPRDRELMLLGFAAIMLVLSVSSVIALSLLVYASNTGQR